jgi:hypothetical protein
LKLAGQHKPNDSLARDDFGQFHFAVMDVFVAICEFIVEFAGLALNFF